MFFTLERRYRKIFKAARPALRGTEFGGGKARAGKNSFPPTPFLFARPSEFSQKSASGFSRKKVRILFKSPSTSIGLLALSVNNKKLISNEKQIYGI